MIWDNSSLWLLLAVWRILANDTNSAEESEAYHPLLPVEKKLILYSLILAVVLLALLIWASYTFFPGRS